MRVKVSGRGEEQVEGAVGYLKKRNTFSHENLVFRSGLWLIVPLGNEIKFPLTSARIDVILEN